MIDYVQYHRLRSIASITYPSESLVIYDARAKDNDERYNSQ